MKPIIPFALLGALLAVGANAATTTPVGYYEFSAVSGGNLFVPSFVNPSSFAGELAGSGATTLTVADGALSADAFNEGSLHPTHYAEVTSGPNAGFVIDIVSNTASVITLASDISGLNLVGDETIAVRPHVTLKSALESAEASLVAFTDTATFYDPSGTVTTYTFGADTGNSPSEGWSSDFSTADGNVVPIHPGTGFVLNVSADADLVVVGEVKASPVTVQLGAGVPNIVGPVNPLAGDSVPLNETGFGSLVTFTDSVTVYEPGPLLNSVTYVPLGDGSLTSDFSSPTTDALTATTGAVIIPAAQSAVSVNSGFVVSP